MIRMPGTDDRRFPWGYLAIALLPLMLLGTLLLVGVLLEPSKAMAPGMVLSLLIGPAGLLAIGMGVVRLWRGDGQRYPALKWLVWLPALVGVAGWAIGLAIWTRVMDESYKAVIDGLSAHSVQSYFQSPDQLVVSRQPGPAWPGPGNSFWISHQQERWYLCTWAPVCYCVPEDIDVVSLCVEFVGYG